MGTPDRLREDGLSEEEIAECMAEGGVIEKEQDPDTRRVSHDIDPPTLNPYIPPATGDGVKDPDPVAIEED